MNVKFNHIKAKKEALKDIKESEKSYKIEKRSRRWGKSGITERYYTQKERDREREENKERKRNGRKRRERGKKSERENAGWVEREGSCAPSKLMLHT